MACRGAFNFHGVMLPDARLRLVRVNRVLPSWWDGEFQLYAEASKMQEAAELKAALDQLRQPGAEGPASESTTALQSELAELDTRMSVADQRLADALAAEQQAQAALESAPDDAALKQELAALTAERIEAQGLANQARYDRAYAHTRLTGSKELDLRTVLISAIQASEAADKALVPLMSVTILAARVEGEDPFVTLYNAASADARFAGMVPD